MTKSNRYLIFLFIVSSLFISRNSLASDEQEQNRIYVDCLMSRNVVPPEIPEEDSNFCLLKAGIKDPGDKIRKKATSSWNSCLLKKAEQYDDRVSPASDIASAIVSLCPDEWRAHVASIWTYPQVKNALANNVSKYGQTDAERIVLLSRRADRKNQ